MDQGGTTKLRFQPGSGKYLAAAAETAVSILDVETQVCLHSLQVSASMLSIEHEGHIEILTTFSWL